MVRITLNNLGIQKGGGWGGVTTTGTVKVSGNYFENITYAGDFMWGGTMEVAGNVSIVNGSPGTTRLKLVGTGDQNVWGAYGAVFPHYERPNRAGPRHLSEPIS